MAQKPQQPEDPQLNPVLLKAEGEAMLQLAQTLQALTTSKAYQDAANPGWWKRTFG